MEDNGVRTEPEDEDTEGEGLGLGAEDEEAEGDGEDLFGDAMGEYVVILKPNDAVFDSRPTR